MSERSSCGHMLLVLAVAGATAGCGGSSPISASRSSVPPSISVSLSPSAPQAIDQGQTVQLKATVTNDSSGQGVLWNLAGPGSLSNFTETSVTYNSPTGKNLTSSQSATVTATSGADQKMRASVAITVNPYPQFPLPTLASGSVGTPYSQTLTLNGGTPPFAWQVFNGEIAGVSTIDGLVPDGLTLDPTTGTISGTPTAGGTWYFEATAKDAAGVRLAGALSIQINPSPEQANPVPFLNQPLAPTAVSPGASDFVLKVSGAGFVPGATVDFNRSALETTFVDSGHLSAVVPASDAANPGTASVTVTNPSPGGGRSNVVNFEVGAPEASPTFVSATIPLSQIPSEPAGLTVADFNEDGKPDLAVTVGIRVYVALGKGDGTFQPASGSPLPVPSPPYDLAATPVTGPINAGDFNNSGHLGLAVGLVNNRAAGILLGNGDGTFKPSSAGVANSLGGPVLDVEPVDFNGDGNLDLAIANSKSAGVDLGYGKGAFIPGPDLSTLPQGVPSAVAVGDFNSDGKLDAVLAISAPSSGIALLPGNGDGTFTPGADLDFIFFGESPSAIVAGDFNGDGVLDIAVTDSAQNDVAILLGLGSGSEGFDFAAVVPVGNQPQSIATGDFNDDGNLDLAIANSRDGTVTLLFGADDGTFQPAPRSPYTAGPAPLAIRAADFNDDGKLDLAVANFGGGVTVLIQQ